MSNQVNPKQTIVFSGSIYQNSTKLLRNVCCNAVNGGVTDLTILFSSDGGSIDDGFALYGFLRSLPLNLTIHNIGFVGSIANAVFLAAKTRLASPHSVFFFHDFHWRYPEPQTLRSVTMTEHLLEDGRLRLQSLFDLHAKKGDPLFHGSDFFKEPVIHSPSTAQAAGIIHGIKDASVPAGTAITNIDWT
jgi:ATP-dependent protease ClpP protease subunit